MMPRRLEPTRLEIPQDESPAEWIEPELTGEIGSVADVVPSRYEAYVRILHPATTEDGTLVRWSDVAAELGRPMHALRQWHVLVGSADPDDWEDSEWSGGAPERGDLWPQILEPLCALLGKHTSCAEHCFFGLWTGWTSWTMRFHQQGAEVPEEEQSVRSGSDMPGPRFELPPNAGREYALLSGPLSAATEIADSGETIGRSPMSPSFIWPADRSWFLASEIDFDSTLVGGSRELSEAILNADKLEAWPVEPGDSLTANADEMQ